MINTPKSSLSLQQMLDRMRTEMVLEMSTEDVMDRFIVWDSLGAHTAPEIPKASKLPRGRQAPKSRFLVANEYNTQKR